MRLTLDVTPTLLRSAGVKNHLYYWSRALSASRGDVEIDYYPFVSELEALHHDRGVESGIPNWRLFLVAAMNFRLTHGLARRLVPEAELFHGSPQLRERPRARWLTSHIHDLTCWVMPEHHTDANVRAAHQMADRIWRHADGLIAVSASAKEDAVRMVGLKPENIQVIPHGVPETYFTVSGEQAARVRRSLGLAKPYALSVGTVEPRKNLERLLDSWSALPQDTRQQFDLVVAGPAGWQSTAILARLRSAAGGVRYLGYVAENDLAGLTAGATLLAYPSLYEGFGFPLAQAMACGLASVTSHVSSMPEVAAGSALLVDPFSEREIRDALLRLLTTPDLRAELGRKGRAHALANYRWEIAARQSWEFFERVVGKG
jgi:glycosyltransferase involved in cell wall biosynthesis